MELASEHIRDLVHPCRVYLWTAPGALHSAQRSGMAKREVATAVALCAFAGILNCVRDAGEGDGLENCSETRRCITAGFQAQQSGLRNRTRDSRKVFRSAATLGRF